MRSAYLKYYWTVASRDCGRQQIFSCDSEVKFVSNDYTKPKTLTTLNLTVTDCRENLTVTDPHDAFETFCA